MGNHDPKTIQELADEQIRRWESVGQASDRPEFRPVIAVSRQTGSIGRTVAERLAGDLGLSLFGGDIVHRIAQQAHISDRVVESLDEKGRSFVDDLVASFEGAHGMDSAVYFRHLVRVVGTIARHGNAVIVGHGSAHILDQPQVVRVRFVGPVDERVREFARRSEIPEDEARNLVRETDAERSAFVRRYFDVDDEDVDNYDLVINGAHTTVAEAAELLETALDKKKRVFTGQAEHDLAVNG